MDNSDEYVSYDTRFAWFANFLFGIIENETTQEAFALTLFEQIVNEGSLKNLQKRKLTTYKGYFHGHDDISALSKDIIPYINKNRFAEYITNQPLFVRELLVENIPWYVKDLTTENVGQVLAEEFVDIIVHTSTKKRSTVKREYDDDYDFYHPDPKAEIKCEKKMVPRRIAEIDEERIICKSGLIALSQNDQKLIKDFCDIILPFEKTITMFNEAEQCCTTTCMEYFSEIKQVITALNMFDRFQFPRDKEYRQPDNDRVGSKILHYQESLKDLFNHLDDKDYYKIHFLNPSKKYTESEIAEYRNNYALCFCRALELSTLSWKLLKKYIEQDPDNVPEGLIL